jgi:predicted TIM-barrel fold metal-dependent hydrolase
MRVEKVCTRPFVQISVVEGFDEGKLFLGRARVHLEVSANEELTRHVEQNRRRVVAGVRVRCAKTEDDRVKRIRRNGFGVTSSRTRT